MKKILFLFSIMFVTFTSCTTDDKTEDVPKTTSVVFAIDQPSTSTTSKQIKRGNIPVWVNTLSITATKNSYSTSDNFTFDEQNGSSFISLSNVALGANTFTANTTTDSPQFFQLTNYTSSASTNVARFADGMNNIDNENPYVLYSGTTNSTIAQTANTVSIPMKTNNGRILTVFQVKDNLKQYGYQAKITASAPGESTQVAISKGNELVTFKWSDSKALKDVMVTYKVEISLINNQSVIVDTYEITQTILASTSLECYFELDFKNYTPTTNSVNITLNFDEWKKVHCTTGDCFTNN
jgi:hypothetical protein